MTDTNNVIKKCYIPNLLFSRTKCKEIQKRNSIMMGWWMTMIVVNGDISDVGSENKNDISTWWIMGVIMLITFVYHHYSIFCRSSANAAAIIEEEEEEEDMNRFIQSYPFFLHESDYKQLLLPPVCSRQRTLPKKFTTKSKNPSSSFKDKKIGFLTEFFHRKSPSSKELLSPCRKTKNHNSSFTNRRIWKNNEETVKLANTTNSSVGTPSSGQLSMNFFFDATEQQQEDDISKIILPDKNGYVKLADEFLNQPKKDTPLLVFVNSRSGSQQGLFLQRQFKRLLNPIQIWDLATDGKPEIPLYSFSKFTRLRLLVCGGDGTVSWILSALESLNYWPPIAILPLGTGNDLARIYGWGGGYNNESLFSILQQVQDSYISLLDRWQLTIEPNNKDNPTNSTSTSSSNQQPVLSCNTPSNCDAKNKSTSNTGSDCANSSVTNKTPKTATMPTNNINSSTTEKKRIIKSAVEKKNFTNYMSIGSDALSALQVHNLRENSPKLFFSRAVNKIWYAIAGAEDAIKASCAGLPHHIRLIADGVEVPIPKNSQGIIILNIDSYTGGVPLWNTGTPYYDNNNNTQRKKRVRRYSESEVSLTGINDIVTFSSNNKNITTTDYVMKRSESFDGSLDGSVNYSNNNDSILVGKYQWNPNGTTMTDSEKYEDHEKKQKSLFEYVTSCQKPSSCQDGKLDIVSYRGNFHLGQIRVGLSNADLLCQCKSVEILLYKKLAVQVDGEPWKQEGNCKIHISRKEEPAIMLHKVNDNSNNGEMVKLLDWAKENQVINPHAHTTLMREFSRRVEYTKQQQKKHHRNDTPDTLFRSMKKAIASSNQLSSMY